MTLDAQAERALAEAMARNPGPPEDANELPKMPTPKTVSTFAPSADSRPSAVLTRGDAVRMEAIDWVWNGWLAAGKMALIAGAPGCGKTTITGAFAATITAGGRWPDGSRCPTGSVVIWSGEDGIEDTLAPRLSAAGANMSRVHFVSGIRERGVTYPFDPSRDMHALAEAMAAIDGVRLLIVDPIVSATAGDSHKNAEVRRGLQPLVDLAVRSRCALLGVTHFTKGTQGRDPVERVTGSLAFGAVTRLLMVAAVADEASGDRLLVRAKSNIGPDGDGYRYTVAHGALVKGRPEIVTSRVAWGGFVKGTARELLDQAEEAATPAPARDQAKEWLADLLAGGAVPSDQIRKDAKEAGHTWGTIRNAKTDLGIRPRKSGMEGGWVWELPPNFSRRCEGANDSGCSTFGDSVSTFGDSAPLPCPSCDGEGCEWCA